MQLKDKVVVVTGSSSGIGQATALFFAKEGARVVVNSRNNMQGGQAVVEQIVKEGGKAVYIQADVSQSEDSKKLIDQAVQQFGTVDVLINNAGGYESQDFLTSLKEDWQRIFDCNLFGAILCSQHVAPMMLKQGRGKILNTASVYGLEHTGDPTGMAYSVAKAGVISLTKNLAKLWSPQILVNAIAPGYVHIPRFDQYPEVVQKDMKSEMRLGRWIEPDEIAHAFLFLAQNDAMTGEIVHVDGGFRLK
ncbi:SDR family oxidoreductase [Candidatus Uhrbacteria bacterium]|nr:SDR family oxidoreductase [Candidatus Uhrbacteria bacterium]